MSTRCNILVQDNTGSYQLYHHCDGYPEGVGEELKDYLNTEEFSLEAHEFALELESWDSSYEYEGKDATLHGDIDYLYKINLEDGTLTCLDMNGNVIFEYCYYDFFPFERGYRKGIEDAIRELQKLL